MRKSSATLLVAGAVAFALLGNQATAAAVAPVQHLIPQSLSVEHEDTLAHLSALASHRGAVGEQAKQALALFKSHIAREQEFILPPLTLLPDLAAGKVTPDMAWAIPMTDRVKAEHAAILKEHEQITDAMTSLYDAARRAKDKDAMDFAQEAVADSLNDMELLEPMVLMIGETLHSKLPPAH